MDPCIGTIKSNLSPRIMVHTLAYLHFSGYRPEAAMETGSAELRCRGTHNDAVYQRMDIFYQTFQEPSIIDSRVNGMALRDTPRGFWTLQKLNCRS